MAYQSHHCSATLLCSACISVFLLASSCTFCSSALSLLAHLRFFFLSQIMLHCSISFCSCCILHYIQFNLFFTETTTSLCHDIILLFMLSSTVTLPSPTLKSAISEHSFRESQNTHFGKLRTLKSHDSNAQERMIQPLRNDDSVSVTES
jgi:hypothetical protein